MVNVDLRPHVTTLKMVGSHTQSEKAEGDHPNLKLLEEDFKHRLGEKLNNNY